MVRAINPCMLLSRRLCGATTLHDILAPHLPWRNLGVDPFAPGHALDDVAELVEMDPDAAQDALTSALHRGAWLTHRYETESRSFNQLLLHLLAESGYTVIHLDRDDEADRLFALALTEQAHIPLPDGLDALRERLRAGHPAPDLGPLAHLIRHELGYRQWMRQELAHHRLRVLHVTHAELYRSGVAGLARVDALFGELGLGSRSALLDDASLLRRLFEADEYAAGLRQYAPAWAATYAHLREQVHATISDWAPAAPEDADQRTV